MSTTTSNYIVFMHNNQDALFAFFMLFAFGFASLLFLQSYKIGLKTFEDLWK